MVSTESTQNRRAVEVMLPWFQHLGLARVHWSEEVVPLPSAKSELLLA